MTLTLTTKIKVKTRLPQLAFNDMWRLIPKPSPTTEACNKNFNIRLPKVEYGDPYIDK